MASSNICGMTIHSLLQLPVRFTNKHSLQGAALQRLQGKLQGKHYIIIDEMSMIGQRMMAWINKRLRQASAALDCPLGGFSVIIVGDFGQLPPVGDRTLFAPPGTNPLSVHGHHIYKQSFRELLLSLRNGTVTQDHWKMLLDRDPNKIHNNPDFAEAIHLYYDKASVSIIFRKYRSLEHPLLALTQSTEVQLRQQQKLMMQMD